MNRERSFAPLINPQSHTLILGSLPGAESLRRQQYYAHPQNAFWRVVYAVFGGSPDEDYALRCQFILSNNLALWDVCGSAERVGSADSKIARIEPNDIAGLLSGCANIRRIVLNGRKAEKEYRRFFGSLSVPAVYAPSTSPAFAALPFGDKLAAWRDALRYIRLRNLKPLD
ncbi:MAG: DNA-deoxyinosine glycosylase [Clostridiales bacterium]|jgi:hypoxanthine-DNA glycosylase|nr:DNA-deoxyinosine glycosylase [Clostridiales bacterium]